MRMDSYKYCAHRFADGPKCFRHFLSYNYSQKNCTKFLCPM